MNQRTKRAAPRVGQRANKPLPQRKGNDKIVVQRLQQLIQEKDAKIDALTQKINEMDMQNKTLQRKVDNLQKSSAPPKSTHNKQCIYISKHSS